MSLSFGIPAEDWDSEEIVFRTEDAVSDSFSIASALPH
jgi:hypothetical protein